MIIDFHNHCYPDHIAPKAIYHQTVESNNIYKECLNGTEAAMREDMKKSGVDAVVMLSVASTPQQQASVNAFAQKINHDHVISFGSIHPDAEDALEQLEEIKHMGLIGVKLHPDNQGFYVDNPKYFPIYRKISQLGLIVLFHTGRDFIAPLPPKCSAQALASILPYLETTVIAAHWGGIGDGENAIKYLMDTDVYLDTAFSATEYTNMDQINQILDNFGTRRILFGSDSPYKSVVEEMEFVKKLGLTPNQLENVLGNNALRILQKHGWQP